MTGTARLAIVALLTLGLALPSVSQAHLWLDHYPNDRNARLRAVTAAIALEVTAFEQERLDRLEATLKRLRDELRRTSYADVAGRQELIDALARLGPDRVALKISLNSAHRLIRRRLTRLLEGVQATGEQRDRDRRWLPRTETFGRYLRQLAAQIGEAALQQRSPELSFTVRSALEDAVLVTQLLPVPPRNLLASDPVARRRLLENRASVKQIIASGSTGIGWPRLVYFLTPERFREAVVTQHQRDFFDLQTRSLSEFVGELERAFGAPASLALRLRELVGEGFEHLADPMALLASGQGMSYCKRGLLRLPAVASQLPAELDREFTP